MCLRAKFRVSPKALITKDKKETTYPAQLITEGIVILLKILVIGMGYRGSKSIIGFISIVVKEQRVDGSSVFRLLVKPPSRTVRCTLVAGKAGSQKKLSNLRLKISQ